MMISTNFVPSQEKKLPADDSVNSTNSFPAITEGQQNVPQPNDVTRHEIAAGTAGSHKLDSRDVAGCNSLKRRLTEDTAPDEMPQKVAKKDPSTNDGETKPPAESKKKLSESEAFMMCFEFQMQRIMKQTKFQLKLATLDKQIALEQKKLEIANLEERAKRVEFRKYSEHMHTFQFVNMELSQNCFKVQQYSLQRQVNNLKFLLGQSDWKKEFVMKTVRKLATHQLQLIPNAEKFTGGVERAVEEYLNKQSWDDEL